MIHIVRAYDKELVAIIAKVKTYDEIKAYKIAEELMKNGYEVFFEYEKRYCFNFRKGDCMTVDEMKA